MNRNILKETPSLLLIIILVGFPQISESIFTPSLPNIADTFQATMGTVQLTMSIYFFAFALGVFFWGRLSDSTGRKPAMLLGLFFYGTGSTLCLFSKNIEFLLFARFIQAFGASVGSIITQTIMRESFDDLNRPKIFGHISAALAFSPAIGPFIGGFVQQYYGFRIIFLILVIMSIFIFCYTFLCLPETWVKEKQKKVKLSYITRRMIKNQRLLTYGFLIGALNGILFSYYAEAPYIFIEYFSIDAGLYGLIGIIIATATVAGAFLSNKLLTCISSEKTILFGLIITLFGSFSFLSGGLVLLFPKQVTILILLISIAILFLGIGTALPNCLSEALTDFHDIIGSAGAIFSLGYYLLVSFFTFLMSIFHNNTLWAMPLYFIILILIMIVFTKKFILGNKLN